MSAASLFPRNLSGSGVAEPRWESGAVGGGGQSGGSARLVLLHLGPEPAGRCDARLHHPPCSAVGQTLTQVVAPQRSLACLPPPQFRPATAPPRVQLSRVPLHSAPKSAPPSSPLPPPSRPHPYVTQWVGGGAFGFRQKQPPRSEILGHRRLGAPAAFVKTGGCRLRRRQPVAKRNGKIPFPSQFDGWPGLERRPRWKGTLCLLSPLFFFLTQNKRQSLGNDSGTNNKERMPLG